MLKCKLEVDNSCCWEHLVEKTAISFRLNERDIDTDHLIGKNNPIITGLWNYKNVVKQLSDDIQNIDEEGLI